MTNSEIFAALVSAGMTKEGACGVMGNMAAESAMRPNNAQDSYGRDDDTYTAQTDNGQNDFVNDSIGYGLCQWTERSRKQKLLAFAKNMGVSIGDAQMQVTFCAAEMQADFPGVWKTVTTSHDLLECTQIVLNVYENPAVKNLGTRMEYAQQAYDFFTTGYPPAHFGETADIDEVPDACPVDGSCASPLDLIADFLRTDACRELFKAYIAGKE